MFVLNLLYLVLVVFHWRISFCLNPLDCFETTIRLFSFACFAGLTSFCTACTVLKIFRRPAGYRLVFLSFIRVRFYPIFPLPSIPIRFRLALPVPGGRIYWRLFLSSTIQPRPFPPPLPIARRARLASSNPVHSRHPYRFPGGPAYSHLAPSVLT